MSSLRLLGFTALATASLFAQSALAATSTNDFVKKANIGNRFEIESSALVMEKSENENLRNFAEQMIKDHNKAEADLKETLAASKSGVQMPEPALDAKHQAELDKLSKAEGKTFEKQYIDAQTKAHKQAVALFEDYSKHGKDAKLKSFATTTLPTLKEHKKHVMELRASK